MTESTLYYGDNLDILRRYVKDESVDLIYLDLPFNSKRDYNIVFGKQAEAQIKAFKDTWFWDTETALTYEQVVEAGGKISQVVQAFKLILGTDDMLAYLVMMAARLKELHRVLKPTGSIYLHCDPTASHYLKLLMDAVFGEENFRNEIVWQRTSSHNDSKKWPHIHDIILFYAGKGFSYNPVFLPHKQDYVDKFYRFVDERGRYRHDHIIRSKSMGMRPNLSYEYKGYKPEYGWRVVREKLEALDKDERVAWSASGRPYLKRYLHEQKGTPASSIWTDIPPLSAMAAERLGYPTQKPEALLERIIRASSKEGDVVLDPFCGCGTATVVAQQLHRRWIGIDITHLAINLIKGRLRDKWGDDIARQYAVVGEPTTLSDAEALAEQNKYQFQYWSLGLVGARPEPKEQKKGADKGIDGRLYFHDEPTGGKTKQILFSVKGGEHVNVAMIRDLRGAMEREGAEIGVFISLQAPTKPMIQEAAGAGFYESPWGKHPRIQILTIEEMLQGKGVHYPQTRGANVTFARAPKAQTPPEAEPMALPLDDLD